VKAWSCKNLNTDGACLNINDELLDLSLDGKE